VPQPKVNIADNTGNLVGVTNNRLDVNATLGVGSSTFTSYPQVTQGATRQTVAAATATVTTCKEIIFQTDPTNVGYIMVKDADSEVETEGIRLYAGDTLVLPVSSTANLSIDADQAGQKVNINIIT
tara:strand:+ start:578 stop:955 length:378 start_codon:yes stop_codon:yes gene_type:complete